MSELYLSTGAFTGWPNGRNFRLALEYADAFQIDGFEWLIFDTWFDHLDDIVREYARANLFCPVVHADKGIGNHLSDPAPEAFQEALRLWEVNLRAAAGVGAKKIVVHLWGLPHSDEYFDLVIDRTEELIERAALYGLEMVPENIACAKGSPLAHIEALAGRYPHLRFTIDTRPAEFSRELTATCESLCAGTVRAGHVHINDYAGGYKEWEKLNPILQPGKGQVDFDHFFAALKAIGYEGSITLEAPSMLKDSVDVETLANGLDFIRNKLN